MTKQPAEELSELVAGTIEDVRLSLPLHRAVLTVRTVDSAKDATKKAKGKVLVSWYEVAFEGMTSFAFADAFGGTGPWAVVEISEALQRDQDGRTEYAFTLTENEDALRIVCDEVRVTFLQSDEWHKSAVR